MLKIGIVGLPNVGKSTLFKALTKKIVDISNYPFCTIDPNVGVVKVPDQRLEKLSQAFKSKKTIPAIVEFYDIAGLVKNASKGEGLGNAFLSHIRNVDAICEVVRLFKKDDIIHVEGALNPKRDMGIIHTELILSDLEVVEKALKKAYSEAKSGKKEIIARSLILEKIKKILESEQLVSSINWTEEETLLIKELSLLSSKPFLIVLNVDEKDVTSGFFQKTKTENEEFIRLQFPNLKQFGIVSVAIKLEAELADLSEEEMLSYKRELDISDQYDGLNELIKNAYKTLDLITFFTTGEDESRAWTTKRTSTAPEAGREIHSDFEEKFIRAEVIQWDKLLESKNWSKSKESGLLRTVGKDYVIKDGDVIEFKI
ncbi:redox-regulated ATPase YchF [Candidatus Parcubacteria bacterium]|nr:MAG: redox-regulated ATPase YchF [Candidatus Parcubacteria bacterium]